jgi:hypothetical protein
MLQKTPLILSKKDILQIKQGLNYFKDKLMSSIEEASGAGRVESVLGYSKTLDEVTALAVRVDKATWPLRAPTDTITTVPDLTDIPEDDAE